MGCLSVQISYCFMFFVFHTCLYFSSSGRSWSAGGLKYFYLLFALEVPAHTFCTKSWATGYWAWIRWGYMRRGRPKRSRYAAAVDIREAVHRRIPKGWEEGNISSAFSAFFSCFCDVVAESQPLFLIQNLGRFWWEIKGKSSKFSFFGGASSGAPLPAGAFLLALLAFSARTARFISARIHCEKSRWAADGPYATNRHENRPWSLVSHHINNISGVVAKKHDLEFRGDSQVYIFIELAFEVRAGGIQTWIDCM